MIDEKSFIKDSIEYYENGRFKSGTLAEDTEINGIKYKKGKWICFYKNGKVKEGILAKGTEMDGITFAGGEKIHFYENKKVEGGILAKSVTIDEIESKRNGGRDYYIFAPFDNVIPTTFFSKIKKMFKR